MYQTTSIFLSRIHASISINRNNKYRGRARFTDSEDGDFDPQPSVDGKGIYCGDRIFHMAKHVSFTILPAVVAPIRRL